MRRCGECKEVMGWHKHTCSKATKLGLVFDCEFCGDRIRGTRVTVHEDGIHVIHLTCHDGFMRERGINIDNIDVFPAGADDE